MAEWRFRELARGEMRHGSTEQEFFQEQKAEATPAESLTREAIQNALDAGVGRNMPVRVRFAFHRQDSALAAGDAERYLAGLRRHLEVQDDKVSITVPPARVAMPFLLVEDFGTRGLEGDPEAANEREAGQDNNFFWFWRNMGRSGKEESLLGRWGLGKTVFSSSSSISAYFGLTRRLSDHRELLLGLSILDIHTMDRTEYSQFGFFGDFGRDPGFASPVDNAAFIGSFRTDFRIRQRNEPGLSVVIPFPLEEITAFGVAEAVILNFYRAIQQRLLEVEISDGQVPTVLTADSLEEVASRYTWRSTSRDPEHVRTLLRFSRETLGRTDHVILNPPDESRAPSWSEEQFGEAELTAARRAIEAGKTVALEVRLHVKPKAAPNQAASFHVYLKRVQNLNPGIAEYVREGMTIPLVARGAQTGTIGLVDVSEGPLAQLLGDSENPAHTRWRSRGVARLKRYEHGPSTVSFVSSTIRALVDLLSPPGGTIDKDLLSSFFPLPKAARRDDDNDKVEVPPERPAIPAGRTTPVAITRNAGGFSIRRNRHHDGSVGPLEVVVAYDVSRGNPMSRYRPWDFDLSSQPIELAVRGAAVHDARFNRLVVTPREEEFSIEVTGFDVRRDLVVRVRELRKRTETAE